MGDPVPASNRCATGHAAQHQLTPGLRPGAPPPTASRSTTPDTTTTTSTRPDTSERSSNYTARALNAHKHLSQTPDRWIEA